jgi:hypothetical protein
VVLLPISGKEIILREISGAEDMLLLGGADTVPRLVRDFLVELAHVDAESIEQLPVGDVEWLLLAVRRALLGEIVQADMLCPSQGCGARIDVMFRVSDYVRHRRPSRAIRAAADSGDPWLSDARTGLTFRVPTLADQIALSGRPRAAAELLRLCVREAETTGAQRKADSLLDKLAPTLSNYITGECPECGARVEAYFDIEQFVLRELRDTAARLYDDVHHIAFAYGWSEKEIVSLPRSRRIAYAERIATEAVSS